MNKKTIFFSIALIILSLLAYGLIGRNDSEKEQLETAMNTSVVSAKKIEKKIDDTPNLDFVYDIGPRFNTIKRDDLVNAKSFSDFIGKEHSDRIESYQSLSVILLEDSNQTDVKKTTNSGVFSADQIKFLRSLDYSTNIMIWADYTEKVKGTGELIESYWTPYLTIVPNKQAVYENGKDALLNYLKEETTIVQKDKLKSAKLYFTITKNGTISNVKIVRTSGHQSIDNMMIELMHKIPGKWQAAENSKGEKVDQELVISFGSKGC